MKTNKLLIIPSTLVTTTLLTGAVLTSTITHADGNTSTSDSVSITVDSACTMTGGPTGESTTDNTYSANVNPGSSTEITGSKLVTVCNDSEGYSIYATGFSGDSYDTNNTKLLSTIDHSYDIDTAVAPASPTPSTPSSWAMKLEAVQGLTPPTIETGWDTYHVVPSSYTQIAEYSSSTTSPSSAGATVQAKYQVYINSTQVADTYTGKVKYTMVHPDDAPAPTPPTPGVYTLSRTDYGESRTQIGQPIPSDVETYDTAAEVMDAWVEKYKTDKYHFFLKHTVVNGIITESYVGFVVTPEEASDNEGMVAGEYAIRGGIDESSLQDKTVFTANTNVLKTAYGYSSHPDRCSDEYGFSCSSSMQDSNIDDSGNVFDGASGMHCNIWSDGSSSCEWQ